MAYSNEMLCNGMLKYHKQSEIYILFYMKYHAKKA